ncbi:MAG: site-specific integrase [bacterium]
MTKNIYQNELRKREFFEHLKGGEGFAESSINIFAEAIAQWQNFTQNEDFIFFNKTKAVSFVEWLKSRGSKTESGQISLTTQYNYLRRIKRFFHWLSNQPNYRKILKNDIDFLRLSKKEARIATSGTKRKIPSFEDVKNVIESIEIKNEIDNRDRAIICLALTTGMRISALVSLKMKSFDKQNRLFDQNPADGVRTKNSKRIPSTFFPIIWDGPEKYFIEWYEYLESKGFGPDDPIFPSTLNEFGTENNSYSKDFISKNFWSNDGCARKIFEKRCKNAGLPYFNPHSFRHSVVGILSKMRLTEEEKRAISLNLGHENVGTTFGSYGYGSMSSENAVRIVQGLKNQNTGNNGGISDEEKAVLEGIIKRS